MLLGHTFKGFMPRNTAYFHVPKYKCTITIVHTFKEHTYTEQYYLLSKGLYLVKNNPTAGLSPNHLRISVLSHIFLEQLIRQTHDPHRYPSYAT